MKHHLLIALTILFSVSATAQTKMSAGAKLLFKGITTQATDAEKERIFKHTGLELAADGGSFTVFDSPAGAQVYPTDMNADGKEELFVAMSSSAFGAAGMNFILFMKDASGVYKPREEIRNGDPTILAQKNLGYNDILIGGPGFEFPVYRWNGKEYKFHKYLKDKDYDAAKPMDIAAFSQSYQSKR